MAHYIVVCTLSVDHECESYQKAIRKYCSWKIVPSATYCICIEQFLMLFINYINVRDVQLGQ